MVGHVLRKDEEYARRRVITMRSSGRRKRRFIDSVKYDMKKLGLG